MSFCTAWYMNTWTAHKLSKQSVKKMNIFYSYTYFDWEFFHQPRFKQYILYTHRNWSFKNLCFYRWIYRRKMEILFWVHFHKNTSIHHRWFWSCGSVTVWQAVPGQLPILGLKYLKCASQRLSDHHMACFRIHIGYT